MAKYAYIRVSTKEQNIDRQLVALEPYRIPERNIYCDYQSGKDFDRPAYKKLLGKLRQGDLLIVKSIDRLGRNYNEILVQWQNITKDIGADILVLDMELLDTREKNGSLTGTLIADKSWLTLLKPSESLYVSVKPKELLLQNPKENIWAESQNPCQ